VKVRYPEIDFATFDILRRAKSGRVSRIRVRGRDDRSVEVEGLAVRWTLDLPDTWFSAKRISPKGKEPGWLFTGRGWGHGVGLCQVGAYGMAVRGHGYREILEHYYSGVEIALAR
jgi:stage II sporulation protein D